MCEGDGMEEWKECKLGDIVEIHRGASPRPIQKFIATSGMPWVKISDATASNSRFINSTKEFIIEDGISKSVIVNPEDLIVSNSATPGLPKIMKIKACIHDGWLYFSNYKNISRDFLYYKFFDIQKHLTNLANGSVFQNLKTDIVKDFTIKLPPLPIQQKIAAILSSLDNKIELNNKINTNLEQQAGALFKNWFVDFEPFGGKMPEGWKVGKLSEYCNFQEGYVNPAQTHNEYFNGDVKWLRAVDINESFILNTSRTLTKCGFESAGKSSFLFKPGSIAISKSGTVGRLGIISDFMCGNRAVIGIELKDQQNLSYIHQYLKSRQTEFPDMAVGSVQKNLYVSILENLDIIIPSKEVLEKYAKICMPFYDQIKTNCVENNNLSSIRDTLLPKLMNGRN